MTRDLAALDRVARSPFRFAAWLAVFTVEAVTVTATVFVVRTTVVAIELIGYDLARAVHLVRQMRPVCALMGHDREPWPPFGCARCDTEYDRVRDGARPQGRTR